MAQPDLIADLTKVFQHCGKYDVVQTELKWDEDVGHVLEVTLAWSKVVGMGFGKERVETMSKVTRIPIKMRKPIYTTVATTT